MANHQKRTAWPMVMLGAFPALFLLPSCEGEYAPPEEAEEPTQQPSDQTGMPAPRAEQAVPDAPQAKPVGVTEVSRNTSYGESFRVLVPEMAPSQEVPIGSRCGVEDGRGVLLTCEPGAACVSQGEGTPSVCEAGLRGPRWDG